MAGARPDTRRQWPAAAGRLKDAFPAEHTSFLAAVEGLPNAMPTEAQNRRIVPESSATCSRFSINRTVHELFEQRAAATPDAVALLFQDQTLSYSQLNERADRLAHHLLRLGVSRGNLIGLCMERSPEVVVGLLGILKAGGAYVPLDPAYPHERLAFMLRDAAAPLVLAHPVQRRRAGVIRPPDSCPVSGCGIPRDSRRTGPRPGCRRDRGRPRLRDVHLRVHRRPQGRPRRPPRLGAPGPRYGLLPFRPGGGLPPPGPARLRRLNVRDLGPPAQRGPAGRARSHPPRPTRSPRPSAGTASPPCGSPLACFT